MSSIVSSSFRVRIAARGADAGSTGARSGRCAALVGSAAVLCGFQAPSGVCATWPRTCSLRQAGKTSNAASSSANGAPFITMSAATSKRAPASIVASSALVSQSYGYGCPRLPCGVMHTPGPFVRGPQATTNCAPAASFAGSTTPTRSIVRHPCSRTFSRSIGVHASGRIAVSVTAVSASSFPHSVSTVSTAVRAAGVASLKNELKPLLTSAPGVKALRRKRSLSSRPAISGVWKPEAESASNAGPNRSMDPSAARTARLQRPAALGEGPEL